MHALTSLGKGTLNVLGLRSSSKAAYSAHPDHGGAVPSEGGGGGGQWLSFGTTSDDKANTPLVGGGAHEEPPEPVDSSTSVDKLLERIALLENKLAMETAKAEGYFEQLQDANARIAGLEQDLRVASIMHRTPVGRGIMRPFRLCFGRAPQPEEDRFESDTRGTPHYGGDARVQNSMTPHSREVTTI